MRDERAGAPRYSTRILRGSPHAAKRHADPQTDVIGPGSLRLTRAPRAPYAFATCGQSTSSCGITHGSAMPAAFHSANAGSAVTASM